MVCNVGVYLWFGPDRALEFTTGYLIEKALAVDNIFVFVVIFTTFAIPAIHQHRRSLYFLIAGIIPKFAYLKVGLSVVLIFVGAKLLVMDVYAVPIAASLGIIAGILGLSIVASLLRSPSAAREVPEAPRRPVES